MRTKKARQNKKISDKIRLLMDEGYSQKRAVAIALSMIKGKQKKK